MARRRRKSVSLHSPGQKNRRSLNATSIAKTSSSGSRLTGPCSNRDHRAALQNRDFLPIVISDAPVQGAASDIQVSAMSDMTTSPGESSDRFFLQERELWESLEFD